MCEMVVLEAVVQWCSVKKVFLGIPQNSLENTCARVSFLIKLQASGLNFIKKETLAQVFSCEFCEISKNTFFHRASSVAAFVVCACPAFHPKNNRQETVANISEKQL